MVPKVSSEQMISNLDPDFEQRLNEVADRITVALDQLIPPASGPEAQLMRAMRHGALSKGKRGGRFAARGRPCDEDGLQLARLGTGHLVRSHLVTGHFVTSQGRLHSR